MTQSWKARMDRRGRANEETRRRELRSMTLDRAARILEGLISHPIAPPRPRADHPVSLSHRMRGLNGRP